MKKHIQAPTNCMSRYQKVIIIRRQSTMRTKNAKMNTRSIAFDPFNSHEAMNFRWQTVMVDTNGADKT